MGDTRRLPAVADTIAHLARLGGWDTGELCATRCDPATLRDAAEALRWSGHENLAAAARDHNWALAQVCDDLAEFCDGGDAGTEYGPGAASLDWTQAALAQVAATFTGTDVRATFLAEGTDTDTATEIADLLEAQ